MRLKNVHSHKTLMLSVVLTVVGSLVTGCGNSSWEVGPAYVSPLEYKNYSCLDLDMESKRIAHRIRDIQNSSWAGQGSVKTAELAKLKGAKMTILRVSERFGCKVYFRP